MRLFERWSAAVLCSMAMIAASPGCRPGDAVRQADPSSAVEPAAGNRVEEGLRPTVAIVVEAPGLDPEEVEAQVAAPIEDEIGGAAGIRRVRSVSRRGGCTVWADLRPDADVLEARRLLAERLSRVSLPSGVAPMLAPACPEGREVLLVALRPAADPETGGDPALDGGELRALADEALRKRLLALPGVSDVLVAGGVRPQVRVELEPERLAMIGVGVRQVEEALKGQLVGSGDETPPRDGERPAPARAAATSIGDLEEVVVEEHDGVPVRLGDVASIRLGGSDGGGDGAIRTRGEDGPQGGAAVILTVLKAPGFAVDGIDRLLGELQRGLPAGVRLERQTFGQADVGVSLRLPPGTGREEQDRVCRRVEEALLEVPELRSVWRRGGRGAAGGSTGCEDGPVLFVALPRGAKRGREEILADIRERIARIPGASAVLGRPVPQTLDCAGADSEIAVKLLGSDLYELEGAARGIEDRLRAVAGVVDLRVDPGEERPRLQVRVDPERAAACGVSAADLAKAVETALHGRVVGDVLFGGRRLALVIGYGGSLDRSPAGIGRLPVGTAGGEEVPVGVLAQVSLTAGPAAVYRENGQRRILVSCNVQGRDRAAVLSDVRKAVESLEGHLPEGCGIEFAGGGPGTDSE